MKKFEWIKAVIIFKPSGSEMFEKEIQTAKFEFDPAEKAVDSFTGRELDYSRGVFDGNIPVMVDSTFTDTALIKKLMILRDDNEKVKIRLKERKQFVLHIHYVVKDKESGASHLVLGLPYGTLEGYVETKRDELFIQRRDGSYNVTSKLRNMIMHIAYVMRCLENRQFHVEELNLRQIYLGESGEPSSMALLHGVKLGKDRVECRKAFAKIIEDIFVVAGKTQSPDIKNLIERVRGLEDVTWGAVGRHPAMLTPSEKVWLLTKVHHHPHISDLDHKMNGWPAEPSLHNLAIHLGNSQYTVTYYPEKFSSFVTLLCKTVANYHENDIITDEIKVTKGCKNEFQFVLFIEEICPNLWIWLSEILKKH